MSVPLFFTFLIAIAVIFLILTHLAGRIEGLERRVAKLSIPTASPKE
jgi:hypothetical protein